MDEFSKSIWQRSGSARQILREARRRFRVLASDSEFENEPDRFALMASTHYSMIKRYNGILLPFAVYHLWRAVVHARRLTKFESLDFSEGDIASTILAKAPRWLGGDKREAMELIESALARDASPEAPDCMVAHTKALMLINYARLLQEKGLASQATTAINQAHALVPDIAVELLADKNFQLVRVKAGIAFFRYEHGGAEEKREGLRSLPHILKFASRIGAHDQVHKINIECRRRGIEV